MSARRYPNSGDIEVTDSGREVRVYLRVDLTVIRILRREHKFNTWHLGQVSQATMRRVLDAARAVT